MSDDSKDAGTIHIGPCRCGGYGQLLNEQAEKEMGVCHIEQPVLKSETNEQQEIFTRDQIIGLKQAIESTTLVTLNRAPTLTLIDHILVVMDERDRFFDRLYNKQRAPWTDFEGNPIYEGDTIVHPCGDRGTVILLNADGDANKWRVDYGDIAPPSRLSLQIGDKGRAVVEK